MGCYATNTAKDLGETSFAYKSTTAKASSLGRMQLLVRFRRPYETIQYQQWRNHRGLGLACSSQCTATKTFFEIASKACIFTTPPSLARDRRFLSIESLETESIFAKQVSRWPQTSSQGLVDDTQLVDKQRDNKVETDRILG